MYRFKFKSHLSFLKELFILYFCSHDLKPLLNKYKVESKISYSRIILIETKAS